MVRVVQVRLAAGSLPVSLGLVSLAGGSSVPRKRDDAVDENKAFWFFSKGNKQSQVSVFKEMQFQVKLFKHLRISLLHHLWSKGTLIFASCFWYARKIAVCVKKLLNIHYHHSYKREDLLIMFPTHHCCRQRECWRNKWRPFRDGINYFQDRITLFGNNAEKSGL